MLGRADQLPLDRLRTLPNRGLIVPWIAWVFRPKAGHRQCHRSMAERSEINSETQWVHRFGDDGIAPVNVLGLMTDELHRYRPRNPSPFEPPCADSTPDDPVFRQF